MFELLHVPPSRLLVLAAGLLLAGCPSLEDPGTPPVDDDDDGADDDDAAPVEDSAEIVLTSFPSTLSCSATDTATVAVRNTGTATWTRESSYKLGAVDDSDPFHGPEPRVWLSNEATIPPGAVWTFEVSLTAPAEPGTYTTDWQMVHEAVAWFGEIATTDIEVTCEDAEARSGMVTLNGNSLRDDDGDFNALGTTLMWAAWGMRNDPERLADNLSFLSTHGFHYIRALGVVGDPDAEDYWDGREIDWRWSDYAQVIADTTDLAYDVYGLRVQWTLIGDGQLNIPDEADRYALVDTFLAMSEGREHKIIAFEIANEAWQNGFEGAAGTAQLRDLSQYMKDRTDILVAASAPAGHLCEDALDVYAGGIADFATIHFDRETDLTDGAWRPVRQPWEHAYCDGLPVGSNNEPIGPGSSVATESDPVKLVSAAIATYVSNLPMYVFHTGAGVRGDEDLWDMAGADAFVHLSSIVPGDLASWDRRNAHWSDSPFVVHAEEGGGPLPDLMWPDLDSPTAGVVRAYGDVEGDRFFVFPMGILNHVLLEARRDMTFDVIDPMTGATLESVTLDAGGQHTLSGYDALVIKGTFL